MPKTNFPNGVGSGDVAAISTLTDNSGGTASGTLAVISDTATKNAVASLAAQIEALRAALST